MRHSSKANVLIFPPWFVECRKKLSSLNLFLVLWNLLCQWSIHYVIWNMKSCVLSFLVCYFEPIWENKVIRSYNTVVEKSCWIRQNLEETYCSIVLVSFRKQKFIWFLTEKICINFKSYSFIYSNISRIQI